MEASVRYLRGSRVQHRQDRFVMEITKGRCEEKKSIGSGQVILQPFHTRDFAYGHVVH